LLVFVIQKNNNFRNLKFKLTLSEYEITYLQNKKLFIKNVVHLIKSSSKVILTTVKNTVTILQERFKDQFMQITFNKNSLILIPNTQKLNLIIFLINIYFLKKK